MLQLPQLRVGVAFRSANDVLPHVARRLTLSCWSRAVLRAALNARRDEVAARLRDAARDPAGGPLRDAVLALLEAERDVVAGMLEADGAR